MTSRSCTCCSVLGLGHGETTLDLPPGYEVFVITRNVVTANGAVGAARIAAGVQGRGRRAIMTGMQLYRVTQESGGYWQVIGPGTHERGSMWRDPATAQRVADLMARAYVKGQESVLVVRRGADNACA